MNVSEDILDHVPVDEMLLRVWREKEEEEEEVALRCCGVCGLKYFNARPLWGPVLCSSSASTPPFPPLIM